MRSSVLRYGFFLSIFVLAPLVVGRSILGPDRSSGRSSFSSSAVGHKAFYRLLRDMDFHVERFGHRVERPPSEAGVFVVLEPGRLFFRGNGRYARGLREWVARGNSALITLGADPDPSVDIDDNRTTSPEWLRKIKKAMEPLRESQPNARSTRAQNQQLRVMASELSRTTDQPLYQVREENNLASWLKAPFRVGRLFDQPYGVACKLKSELQLGLEPELTLTRPRIFKNPTGRILVSACGQALVIEHRIGSGIVFLLSEPRLFHNLNIGKAAHATLGVRLIEKLAQLLETDRVYFEEFSHGRTEARTLGQLFFRGNGPWLMGQVLFAALVWLWFRMARRRTPLVAAKRRNRSRIEMIDGLARLYALTGDRVGVLAHLRRDTILWLHSRVGRLDRVNLVLAVSRRTKRSVDEIEAVLALPVTE